MRAGVAATLLALTLVAASSVRAHVPLAATGSGKVGEVVSADGLTQLVDVPVVVSPGAAARAPAASPPAAAGTPRRLVLKLRPGANVCLSCAVMRAQPLAPSVAGSRLDLLNRRANVRAAWPLLRARARQLTPESHAAAMARQLQLRARFPSRAGRAPRRATFPDFSRTYVLEVDHAGDLNSLARAYAADPAVEYCEPDHVVQTALVPNDPYFATRGAWGQDFDDLWGVKQIAAPAAWDTTRGAGVVVAVVDTGIDYTHPDIAANVWINAAEIPGNGVDDDGNGYIDDIHGWDFADGDADPMDDHLHGTHVAGTIAAVGNNASGVVGVAFESKVMAVRGLNRYGFGLDSDLAQAIVYAVDNGTDVINASWGGGGHSAVISDAIAYAHAAGVVFVAAAGNSTEDSAEFFPANDPNAVTVSAFTHLDTRADFSNFGVKLDVAAPGGGDAPPPRDSQYPVYSVLSLLSSATVLASPFPTLVVGGQYLRLAGTSMATPHVVGVAALVLAAHPDFSVEQVRQALRTTADDIDPPGPDLDSGYGRVNAARAVTAPPPLAAHLTAPVAGTYVGETVFAIIGSAAGPGFVSYSLEYGPAPAPASWTPILGPITTPVDEGALGDWDVQEVPDGSYVLRLRVERAGETFIDRVPVTLGSIAIDQPERLAALRPDGPIEIRGTAAGAAFVSYQVEYRRPAQNPTLWRTDGLTPGAPAGTPARKGVLATLDASSLIAGDRFDFRLTVENGAGTVVRTRSGIVIDPTLRAGWPQQLAQVADRQYLTVADLDGDGVKEILVGSGEQVVVFEPDGSVRPGWPQSTTLGLASLGSPIVADVAGDASPEVIATDRYALFAWSADGVLLPGFPVINAPGCSTGNLWLTASDLDGDGKDEIICTSRFETHAFFGNGGELQNWSLGANFGSPVVVGNALGDARPEAAQYTVTTAPWRVTYRSLFHGALMFYSPDLRPVWFQRVKGSFFPRVGMADMDGDGQLDPVVLAEGPANFNNNKVSVAAFTSALGTKIPLTKLTGISRRWLPRSNGLLAYADLDRDGRAEAYLYTGRFSGALLTPNSGFFVTFQDKRGLTSTPRPTHQLFIWNYQGGIAIGDIDGDGEQELVSGAVGNVLCSFGGSYCGSFRRALVVQRRDGTLHPEFPKPVPEYVIEPTDPFPIFITISFYLDDPRYATPAIADLDGDGLKEVLWVDPETTRLFVWNVAGTPGPEFADWPMYHHDPKHTNVLPATR